MATTYKDAQVVGTASTSTYSTLYSTGGATTAVVSSIIVANEATSAVTIRIGLAASAGTPASGSFLVYDRVVPANDTLILNFPLALGTRSSFVFPRRLLRRRSLRRLRRFPNARASRQRYDAG